MRIPNILIFIRGSLIVNYTSCQLQQIEASISRSTFTPNCNADGSFRPMQCSMSPTLKCWQVDKEGRKIQDMDVTLNYPRQPMEAKEKRIGQFADLVDKEIGNLYYLVKAVYAIQFSMTIPLMQASSRKPGVRRWA